MIIGKTHTKFSVRNIVLLEDLICIMHNKCDTNEMEIMIHWIVYLDVNDALVKLESVQIFISSPDFIYELCQL